MPPQQPPDTPTSAQPHRAGLRLVTSLVEFFTGLTALAIAALGIGAVTAIAITITLGVPNLDAIWQGGRAAETSTPAPGDSDSDSDGVSDPDDNCESVANPHQEDTNQAGRGDACDEDDDNDKVNDNAPDNCRTVWNPGQEDVDEDGRGDACDEDEGTDTHLPAGSTP